MYNKKVIADYFSMNEKSVTSKIIDKSVFTLIKGEPHYHADNIKGFPAFHENSWNELEQINPQSGRTYRCIELFAGAGGMALGLDKAGFETVMLNEFDKHACATLRKNKGWHVIEGDIRQIDFKEYANQNIDVITGGFPCQAFSHAGKRLGFDDIRGTLFFEFARAIKEVQPKIFLGENVKGLLTHDKGNTIATIKNVIKDLGYTLIEPKVLNAMLYKVPQKRERVALIGIRNDLYQTGIFQWPSIYQRIMTVSDALYSGQLYDGDVPASAGVLYKGRKKEIMAMVPEGGNWKDLPLEIQKEYLQGSFELGGGKTGIARRLSRFYPSLTIVCTPAQKQTERCHPIETRPLTVRESARLQTFPDNWEFQGSIAAQYKQVGNAVPVNLAYALGKSLIATLNKM
jgi:DNA (cytosine-5)-methyltransferase 1